jgi:hypothetical protein
MLISVQGRPDVHGFSETASAIILQGVYPITRLPPSLYLPTPPDQRAEIAPPTYRHGDD